MSLTAVLTDLTTRIATECKSLRTLLNGNVSDLSGLTTTTKTNLVLAINELQTAISSINSNLIGINDISTTATDDTWSVSKIVSAIATAKDEILGGAGAAFDTLKELSDALASDPSFATTINTALANRVRYDAEQTLTSQQQIQTCINIGVGDPTTNFVTIFNTGLI